MKPASPPVFKSKLRPVSIHDLERMTAAQLHRREAEEEQERRQWLDEQRRKPRPAGGEAMTDELADPTVVAFPQPPESSPPAPPCPTTGECQGQ
jgi:hypothetical protein